MGTSADGALAALGGEDGLRALIDRLVERFARDLIIGFHFEGKDLARIKAAEFSFARAHLCGAGRYEGRPIGALHKPLRINRGQFRRRLALVRTVLREQAIDEQIITRWLEAEAALEPVITDGTDCVS